MKRILACLIVIALATGCTRIAYKEASYWSIGQRKSLRIKTTDGTEIEFNTGVDPVAGEIAKILANATAIP